jgi:hypothetical protein
MNASEGLAGPDYVRGLDAIAKFLGVSRNTAQRLAATRQIPVFRIGGRWMMARDTAKLTGAAVDLATAPLCVVPAEDAPGRYRVMRGVVIGPAGGLSREEAEQIIAEGAR